MSGGDWHGGDDDEGAEDEEQQDGDQLDDAEEACGAAPRASPPARPAR